MPGYAQTEIEIDDPTTRALSARAYFSIVRHTGRPGDTVAGTVYDLTPEELLAADRYEVAPYTRVEAVLRSGRTCWVYADVRPAAP